MSSVSPQSYLGTVENGRKEVSAMSKKTSKVYRDAGSGQFVTKKYAENHPKTTVKETVKK
jgi:hypothetical protein